MGITKSVIREMFMLLDAASEPVHSMYLTRQIQGRLGISNTQTVRRYVMDIKTVMLERGFISETVGDAKIVYIELQRQNLCETQIMTDIIYNLIKARRLTRNLNTKRGRGRPMGYQLTDETKHRIADSRYGRSHSVESRIGISTTLCGYVYSDRWNSVMNDRIRYHLMRLELFATVKSKKGISPHPQDMCTNRREALNRMLDLVSDGLISALTQEMRLFITETVLPAFENSYQARMSRTIRLQAQLNYIRERITATKM